MPIRWTIRFTFVLLLNACALASPALSNCDNDNLAKLLETGNQAYESGNFAKAESSWLSISQCPQSSPDWPKAVYNLALLKMKQADYPSAIQEFEAVLNSNPDDREAGGSLMETNRNYSHRSSLGISACYERMGQYRELCATHDWQRRVIATTPGAELVTRLRSRH